jgi:hypothetical protein
MPYGSPVQVIEMGSTEIPRDVYDEFIESLRDVWTYECFALIYILRDRSYGNDRADKYHLLDNNCSAFYFNRVIQHRDSHIHTTTVDTFSNEVCQFLVGKTIPSHITSLPADVLSTPLGQAIRPLIESMFGPSALAPASMTAVAHPPAEAFARSLTGDTPTLKHISDMAVLQSLVSQHRCVIIAFTNTASSTVTNEFELLVTEYDQLEWKKRWGPKPWVFGGLVDVGKDSGMARDFEITSIPTFKCFLDGVLVIKCFYTLTLCYNVAIGGYIHSH